jgi:uncharacterized oligopeptide transporter (OPT) family protein
VSPVTLRAVLSGLVLSLVLCAMNSYLTLSFGVIEEGPTIAALFFFAIFCLSKTRISTTELVIVATMGSAGGSFGFIANFYAAKAMLGEPYTLAQMMAFGTVSSMVGLIIAIPLREILVVKERLPWPGARAVESVVTSLAVEGDRRQPLILLGTFALAFAYVLLNNEDGVGWFPAEIPLGGLIAYGGALSLAPFAIGSSYLMGFRTCVGFLAGAVVLMLIGTTLPDPSAPQRFVWPGIGFLIASGMTLVVINWRMMLGALTGLLKIGDIGEGDERILPPTTFVALAATSIVAAVVVMVAMFDIPVVIVLAMIAIGGLIQNVIATRAQAQTNFNPARVMGILMQGVASLFGGNAASVNIGGAGFVAGSGAQAGMMTSDMVYGRHFRVPPRWQFFAQMATVVPSAIIAALVFDWIAGQKAMTIDTAALAAPVAKVWATTAMIFDGSHPMPPGARDAFLIGAAAGVLYTLIERIPRVGALIPCSVGLGIGLVLPPAYGIAFFVGGFIQWIVLGRWMKWSPATLTTISVGCVVAEGIGGVTKALLAAAHIL